MELRESLKPLPKEMVGRPIDHRGYPVPWFVTEKDALGRWDFVHLNPNRIGEAIRFNKCFVSGEKLGKYRCFIVGPMCTINRISSNGPIKPSLAEWVVRSCPFLANPSAKRPGKTEEFTENVGGGMMATRNPGVSIEWVTDNSSYDSYKRLFFLGEPTKIRWWREGRLATLAEAREAFDSGVELLGKIAKEDGEKSMALFNRMVSIAREFLPA